MSVTIGVIGDPSSWLGTVAYTVHRCACGDRTNPQNLPNGEWFVNTGGVAYFHRKVDNGRPNGEKDPPEGSRVVPTVPDRSGSAEHGATRVVIIIRHLDAEHGLHLVEIAGGTLTYIAQNSHGRSLIDQCRTVFPGSYAQFSDWVYERSYSTIPPARVGNDPSGYGDIPFQSEDLLLAMRLSQPGDVTFVAQAVIGEDCQAWFQMPYRYFGAIESTRPYYLDPQQIPRIETIRRLIAQSPAAYSTWFLVAKRFFLYGGAKEFNPFIGELDRILDFAVALEAALVFEKDFVGRLIRNRAVALLGISNTDHADAVKRLVKSFYGHRSTIAHGDPLPIDDPGAFRRDMLQFEGLVRDVLMRALEVIPADNEGRKQSLKGLADVTDNDRVDQLKQSAARLSDVDRRQQVLDALQS